MKKHGILDYIGISIIVGGMLLMLYGLINYPAAPIRQVGDKFLDKRRSEYTAEEFRAFEAWETTLFTYYGCGIPVVMLIVAVDKMRKKRK